MAGLDLKHPFLSSFPFCFPPYLKPLTLLMIDMEITMRLPSFISQRCFLLLTITTLGCMHHKLILQLLFPRAKGIYSKNLI